MIDRSRLTYLEAVARRDKTAQCRDFPGVDQDRLSAFAVRYGEILGEGPLDRVPSAHSEPGYSLRDVLEAEAMSVDIMMITDAGKAWRARLEENDPAFRDAVCREGPPDYYSRLSDYMRDHADRYIPFDAAGVDKIGLGQLNRAAAARDVYAFARRLDAADSSGYNVCRSRDWLLHDGRMFMASVDHVSDDNQRWRAAMRTWDDMVEEGRLIYLFGWQYETDFPQFGSEPFKRMFGDRIVLDALEEGRRDWLPEPLRARYDAIAARIRAGGEERA